MRVLKYTTDKKYVITDCFDTILHRQGGFQLLQKNVAQEIIEYFGLSLTVASFLRMRKDALGFVDASKKNCSYDMDDVYRRIYHLLKGEKAFSEQDFSGKSCEIEIELEKKSHYLDKGMLKLIRVLNERKIKIICLTDYYFKKEVIEDFFDNLKIKAYFEDILVSCEYGKTKYGGDLYQALLDRYDKKDIAFMIGDSKVADVHKAQQNGIKAIYRKYNYDHDKPKRLHKEMKKVRAARADCDTRQLVDYSFSLYLFTQKLYKTIKANGHKNICFFSREGFFLKELFDNYLAQKKDNTIKTHYVYISRKSVSIAGLPSIENFTPDAVPFFKKTDSTTVPDFLKSISFSEQMIQRILDESRVDKEEIKNFLLSSELERVIASQSFVQIYEQERTKGRKNLIRHLDNLGFDYLSEGLCIVDVGWFGTMQNSLYAMFSGSVKLNGYYLGIAQRDVSNESNKKEGLLFDCYSCIPYSEVYEIEHVFYERLLAAPHGPTLSYNDDGSPILEDDENGLALFKLVRPLQEAILHRFSDIGQRLSRCNYTEKDVMLLFALMHFDIHAKMKRSTYKFLVDTLAKAKNNFLCFGESKYAKRGNPIRLMLKRRLSISKILRHQEIIRYLGIFSREIYRKKLGFLLPLFQPLLGTIGKRKIINSIDRVIR